MNAFGTAAASMSSGEARCPAAAPVDAGWTAGHAPRILLCDAESQSLHALRVVLHGAGFVVDATRSAQEALDRGALSLPTAAIIELVLPDGDGVEVCRRLREWSAMPVIILSAVCAEQEQVRALEAGADDYVTKPFRPRELVARLLANLRRAVPRDDEPCVAIAHSLRLPRSTTACPPMTRGPAIGLRTRDREPVEPVRSRAGDISRSVREIGSTRPSCG